MIAMRNQTQHSHFKHRRRILQCVAKAFYCEFHLFDQDIVNFLGFGTSNRFFYMRKIVPVRIRCEVPDSTSRYL